MKVKTIYPDLGHNGYHINLDNKINSFIKDKKVIDIKYQANISYTADSGVSADEVWESALVMYEEGVQDD